MHVEIRRVESRRDLKRFTGFSHTLYAGHPYRIPPIRFDELNTLRKDRNPAFDFCEAEYWLALRGGRIVGRIAGIVNQHFIEIWGQRYARFGWVDFIDDADVVDALFDTAEAWAREKGMDAIHGPLGFTDLDPEGMLVEGFDELGTLGTIYNHPYYPGHIERRGYVKDVDWVEYDMTVPEPIPDKLTRIRKIVEKRGNLRLATFANAKAFRPYARPLLELVNTAYAGLYGFVPLTERQMDAVIKQYFGFMRTDFVFVALDENDGVAGFGLTLPSLGRAVQKSDGRLFPFGWLRLLRALKKPVGLDLALVAVRPELQKQGVAAMFMEECARVCNRYGIRHAESNPELESNEQVQAQWKFFDIRQHKRRRCYIKQLGAPV